MRLRSIRTPPFREYMHLRKILIDKALLFIWCVFVVGCVYVFVWCVCMMCVYICVHMLV